MSERVMTILESCFPSIEVYSIDEAFADMTGLPDPLESIGRQVQTEIKQKTGIPSALESPPQRRWPNWPMPPSSAGKSRPGVS